MERWRFALASVVGLGHIKAGLPCQDAATCRVIEVPDLGEVLVGVVSDGAGTAAHSDEGSRLAASALTATVSRLYAEGRTLCDLTVEAVREWLVGTRSAVQALADEGGSAYRDFACTLLGAVVEPDRAAFLQIGDGAIVVSPRGDFDQYSWVFWPQRGEYANFTRFITDEDAVERVEVDIINGEVEEVAVFSDGLQSLALHYATQTAHAPLFRSLFGSVRSMPPGHGEQLSSLLVAFLGSDRVNSRTDDDKSIVLASRRATTARTTPTAATAESSAVESQGEAS